MEQMNTTQVETLHNVNNAEAEKAPWGGLWTLAGGLAMIVLDGTIVSVAMPDIINALHMDLTDAQWVSALYNVVFAALLLPLGRLGDMFGRKSVFTSGIIVFILGSLVATVSPNTAILLASRVLQGIGGAMVLPSTLSTVSASFRGKNRAVAFGIWGAVMSGAAALGPLLGGWFTSALSWRWIFLVNVPIGIIIFLFALRTVPETVQRSAHKNEKKKSFMQMDLGAAVLSAIGAALLVYGLIEGESFGWWNQTAMSMKIGSWTWPKDWAISPIPVSLVLGALLVVAFVMVERSRIARGAHVMLDITLFSIRTFSWGNLAAGCVAAGEFALVFVLPLYLVNALGLSIMNTGLILAGMALGAFFSGAMARHLSAWSGPANVVIIGLLLEIFGVLGTSFAMNIDYTVWYLVVTLIVYGVGLGLASAQLTSVVLGDVPIAQSGVASATQSTVRQLGSALGAAIAGTALAVTMNLRISQYLTHIQGLSEKKISSLIDMTRDSAGNAIMGLRHQIEGMQQIPTNHMPAPQVQGLHQAISQNISIVDALSQGFADSSRMTLMVATIMLGLGLIAALFVKHYANKKA